MTPPGTRLRALAAQWCSARTMERLVDPVLADLQAEYEDAARTGRRWRRRWVWILGHMALVKVMMWLVVGMVRPQRNEDWRALIRTCGVSLAVVAGATVLLCVPVFLEFDAWNHPGRSRLAIYAIPQAIPLAIPVGLTLGVLAAFGRVPSSRWARCTALVLAVAASAASLTMLAWVAPTANQAFRTTMIGRPVAKGVNELTLAELAERVHRGNEVGVAAFSLPASTRHLERAFHARWAFSCAPLALTLFAISLTSRGQRGWLALGAIGVAAIFGYYALLYAAFPLALHHTVPAFVPLWAPNAVFVLVSLSMIVGSPRERLRRSPEMA